MHPLTLHLNWIVPSGPEGGHNSIAAVYCPYISPAGNGDRPGPGHKYKTNQVHHLKGRKTTEKQWEH